jgi:hypothetical protein
MAAGLTDHTWSIKQILTSQVTPQLLMIMKEAQKLEVFQLPNEGKQVHRWKRESLQALSSSPQIEGKERKEALPGWTDFHTFGSRAVLYIYTKRSKEEPIIIKKTDNYFA